LSLVKRLGKKPTRKQKAIRLIARSWKGGERTSAAAMMRDKGIHPDELPECPGIENIK
jgi:hypothetical protein